MAKITLVTVSGETHYIEIDDNITVLDLKGRLLRQFSEKEMQEKYPHKIFHIRLVEDTKILDDNHKL